MKFPYVKIPASDLKRRWISRPIIPVILSGPNKSIIIDALIDSGADKSLFHIALAQEIGLNLKKGEKELFSGIEGTQIISFLNKIQLQIVGLDKKIEISAGFTESPGVFAILGQEGFFDAYRIEFERNHNIIEITPTR